MTLCWRSFPSPDAAWKFRTIASGKGFSCGVLKNNNRVKCWGVGEIGDELETQFGDFTLSSLVAGESHVCGILKINGGLICRGSNVGGQLDVPSNSAFGFSNLAMGANHSCGIRRENGFVICWGGGSKRLDFVNPITRFESFESIVSGLDLVCGLSSKNLSILCWGPGWSSRLNSGNVVPLPMVIPGSCVQASCNKCGVYPNSDSLCSGSGSICKSCEPEVELPIPALVMPTMPRTPSLSHEKNSYFLAFGIVGSVGGFAGICTIVYLFWSGCGFLHKRIYNSVQTRTARGDAGAWTHNSGSSGRFSRSSSVKRESPWKFRHQRNGTSFNKHSDKAEKFSLSDLAVATSNFLLENKIGSGSFGIVYKGKLVDGREVAIKRGDNASKMNKFQEKENAFASELLLLSRLHHKHLVELVGFCEEKDERLLVYEYMSNGSLHDHLHNKNNVEKGSSVLNSWKIRIKIALDAARGIEYLHNYAVPPIIHRDIKSSNILLDANWTAKVSDFGLSLMGPESDQDSMSIRAVGTVGYIDPESYVLNILTAKSDVYGLGVVVLEILTGKRAVFKEEGLAPMSVVEYSVPNIRAGQLRSILDKRVEIIEMNEAEAEAVELVALTALRCVNLEGVERPTVTEIVANLERALAHCEESRDSISSSTFSVFSQ